MCDWSVFYFISRQFSQTIVGLESKVGFLY